MGFSTDETLLNSINLDSINQYRQFIDQIRPILMQEAGYEEVDSMKSAGYSKGNEVFERVRATGYYDGKLDQGNAARQLGVSQSEFDKLQKLGKEYYNLEQRPVSRDMINSKNKEVAKLAKETFGRLDAINKEVSSFQIGTKTLQKTAAQLAKEKEFAALQDQQLAITKAQADRQQKALAGEIETSPILQKQIQDEFNTFKENQARAGNVIMGDNIDNATGKGSAAIESLRAFKDNATAAKQREIQSIIQGETPLYYGGLGLAGNVRTAAPNLPYGGLSSMSLSGMQPFQFDRQMNWNQQMAQMGSKSSSGKSGLLGSLGGSALGIGAAAMFPGTLGLTGALQGAQLGSLFGGGAGTLFGGGY